MEEGLSPPSSTPGEEAMAVVVAEGSRDAPAPPGERAASRRVLVMGGDVPVPVLAGRDRPGPDVEPWAAGVPPVRTAPLSHH